MGTSVVLGSEAREKMKKGIDTLANAVKVTLGPRGRHAAIQSRMGPPMVTKDGVTVARYINLDDPIENMGAQLIKAVASDANSEAGDGTTTATVLAQEIYSRGLEAIDKGSNPVLIKRGIDLAVDIVVKSLEQSSVRVSDEKVLKQVATISANNDAVLGQLIAEAVSAVGSDGIIAVEEASGRTTEVEYSDGLEVDRGWLHEAFITDSKRFSCELKNPYILLYDGDLKDIRPIGTLLAEILTEARQVLLIVRNIEPSTLEILIRNRIDAGLECCVIRAPGFGDFRKALMEDLAVLSGARLITSDDGSGLSGATMSDLGTVRKVSVGMNKTKFIDGSATSEQIESVVLELKERLKEPSIFPEYKAIIKGRISRLTGGVAIFKVGATSESEMREKKDRVEDAINAVKSALSEGVVPGGGCGLLHCLKTLNELDTSDLIEEEVAGIQVVKDALKAPFNQILANAGLEKESAKYLDKIVNSDSLSGFDALKLKYVDNMLEAGIIDPAKVVRSALQHAASGSGTLLTTEVTISVQVKDKE